ncbi:hypothetical protein [Actinokineospora cianjurensis]|uniref:Uncharacterized protein n=1 Tax=Actinokineospora cianjurensis TaxID=585224 RepID=A0A421BCA3_9PSEU|nr:hypothetical protein [Actinokineospora cianjurensis]RLK61950.1 hypothetical protein CLV68_2499 [Actinokineospora cianjurensis]
MTTAETRLHRRIRLDFPEPGSAQEILRLLADLPHQTGDNTLGTERVHAAIILLAQGDLTRLHHALTLSTQDWRDLLVTAELADGDWPTRLDQELGPITSSSSSQDSK